MMMMAMMMMMMMMMMMVFTIIMKMMMIYNGWLCGEDAICCQPSVLAFDLSRNVYTMENVKNIKLQKKILGKQYWSFVK